MLIHTWKCECGEIIEAIGPQALLSYVQDHERDSHDRERELTVEQLIASPRYRRPEGASRYTPPEVRPRSQSPTYQELAWLKKQGIAWYGDNRNT